MLSQGAAKSSAGSQQQRTARYSSSFRLDKNERKRTAKASHPSKFRGFCLCFTLLSRGLRCCLVDFRTYTKSTSNLQRNLANFQHVYSIPCWTILSLLFIFRHRCNCLLNPVPSYHTLYGMTGKRSLEKHPSASLYPLGNTACADAERPCTFPAAVRHCSRVECQHQSDDPSDSPNGSPG